MAPRKPWNAGTNGGAPSAAATRTAAAVLLEIEALDEAAKPRTAQLAEHEALRPSLIEAGDVDGVEALDAKIRRARIEGEIDDARGVRLQAEHDRLDAAERHAADQAERRATHAAAQAAYGEAHRLFHEEYPRLAAEIAAMLERSSELRRQIEAANDRLPEGTAAIPIDYEPARGRAAILPGKVKGRRHVWFDKISGQPTTDYREGDDRYERRVVPQEIESAGSAAVPHVALHDLVSLPGLAYGDEPFWAPTPGQIAPPFGATLNPSTLAALTAARGLGRPAIDGRQ